MGNPAELVQPQFRTDLRDQVFYLVMPCAYRSGTGSTGPGRFGDFDGLADAIGYMVDLGVTTVVTTPPFPSVAYHGYQHGPPTSIDPRLGGDAAFARFLHTAHEAGLRVVIDLVAYGIDPRTLQHQDEFADLAWENAHHTRTTGYSARTWNNRRVRFAHWNLRSARARARVIQWALRWLDPDQPLCVDGFRFDHVWLRYPADSTRRTDGLAPGSPPWADGWGYHLDPFWAECAQALKAIRPDALLLAEPAAWHTTGEDLLGVFDGAIAKPWLFAMRDAAIARDPCRWQPVDHGQLLCCTGDHDTDRLASVVPGGTGVNGGAGTRDPSVAALAMALLGSSPPMLYAGDELGMKGKRQHRLGGDAGDLGRREPFRWTATDRWPNPDHWRASRVAVACRFNRPMDGISVEEQQGLPGSMLETTRALLRLRKERPELRQGHTHYAGVPAEGLWAVRRSLGQAESMVVANLSRSTQKLDQLPDLARRPHLKGVQLGPGCVAVAELRTPAVHLFG